MHPQNAAAGYQDYGSMYPSTMDMAWHAAAYTGLYRGYEAAGLAEGHMWTQTHPHMNSFISSNRYLFSTVLKIRIWFLKGTL